MFCVGMIEDVRDGARPSTDSAMEGHALSWPLPVRPQYLTEVAKPALFPSDPAGRELFRKMGICPTKPRARRFVRNAG